MSASNPAVAAEYEEPRQLSIANINCSTATTPFPVMSLRPFAPFYTVRRGEPFVARNAWKGAINGIKALKRLKLGIGKKERLRSELTLVTGHTHGHMMVWNGDTFALKASATHFNNVSVANIVVTNTMIYTTVEKDSLHGGKAGDDCDVYVWDLNTMELLYQLSGHEERVTCIAVDEENEFRVVTGSIDKLILVWDVKRGPTPVQKLVGHTMAVSKLILNGNTLYSGGGDGAVRVWDLAAGTCVATLEGHQAAVTYMAWASAPTAEVPSGTFLTACSGGVVKAWLVEGNGQQLTNVWSNKAHKALTTDVCTDGPMVVSSSATDGINFYNAESKKNVKFALSETGVRNLAIDSARKLVIAGSDNGQLTLLAYHGLMVPSSEAPDVTVFATLQPHLGSITALILERSQNGQWERIVTASNDHSLFTLDFDVNRDSKSFSGFIARTACQITHTGTVVAPCENSALLFDPIEMVKKSGMQKSIEGHTKRVTAVRYSEEFAKVITGSEDGFVRTSDVLFFSEPELQNDELIEACDAANLGMAVRCLSKPQRFLIAAGLQKTTGVPGQVSKAGGIAVISFTRGIPIGQTINTFLFPTAVELLAWEQGTEKILHFTVVAQLRNGELITFNGNEEGTFGPIRTIMREQIPYSPEREMDGGAPMPVAVKARMNNRYHPPRIELLAIENGNTFRSFDVSEGGNSTSFINAQMSSEVIDFQVVNQGECFVALALANSDTSVINTKGEFVFNVGYDGSVIDYVADALRPPRRRRTFIKVEEATFGAVKYPAASAIHVSHENRYIAIGYRDGVIQLFDVPSKRVCRRIHSHVTAVAKILPLRQSTRFMSFSAAGTMRIDTIYSRNVRDTPSTPPAEPLKPHPVDHETVDDGQNHRVRIAAPAQR